MLAARVVEWFLLRERAARAREHAPAERLADERRRALARQKRDAAATLWAARSEAEALRLAWDARCIATCAKDTAPPSSPAFDAEFAAKDADQFHAWLAACDAALEAHEGDSPTPSEVTRTRVDRVVGVVFAIATIVVAAFALRPTPTIKATASASWDARYEPARVVDGSERTDWLLPDKTSGWIQLQLIPERKVRRIRVLNARNLGFADRGTHEFHVEALRRGQVVKSFDGRFEAASAEPDWRSFDVDAKVDAVKLDVRSWYLAGGGFGEIAVE